MAHVNIKSHFDPNEIEDTSNPYPRPLFLVPLPPLECQLPLVQGDGAPPPSSSSSNADDAKRVDILAYGGDNGCIYLLNSSHSSANNSDINNSSNNDNDNDDNLTTKVVVMNQSSYESMTMKYAPSQSPMMGNV